MKITRLMLACSLKLLATLSVSADVVEIIGADEPVAGIIIAESSTEFTLLPVGQNGPRRLPKTDVKSFVRTIDQQRLSELDIRALSPWRDIAEELASIENDPAARDLAVRLLGLSLYHGFLDQADPALLRSIARNLIALATNDAQRIRFEQFAFMYAALPLPGNDRPHPGHPSIAAGNLKTNGNKTLAQLPSNGELEGSSIAQLAQAISRDQFDVARRIIESDRGGIIWQDARFALEEANIRSGISDERFDNRLKLHSLRIELSTLSDLVGSQGRETETMSQDPLAQWPASSFSADLRSEFPFDFSATQFAAGKWHRPDENTVGNQGFR